MFKEQSEKSSSTAASHLEVNCTDVVVPPCNPPRTNERPDLVSEGAYRRNVKTNRVDPSPADAAIDMASAEGLVVDYGTETPRHVTKQRRDHRIAARIAAGQRPRAIIVARVSARMGRVGDSYQSVKQIQLPQCRTIAAQHGFEIVDEVIHEDKKGGEVKRLLHVVEAIEKGRADILIVWAASRFTRRARHGHNVLHRIREVGGDLKSVEGNPDIHTPEGTFLFTILLAKAEMEYDQHHVAFQTVKRNAMGRGVLPYKPPYGYRRTTDQTTGRRSGPWEPDPQTAPWVSQIYEWRRLGWGTRRIARELNTRDVRSPKGRRWSQGTVATLLPNPAYRGEARYGKWDRSLIPSVPALVPTALWHEVNELAPGTNVAANVRDGGHLLRGFVICASCGGLMGAEKRKRGLQYHCKPSGRATPCTGPAAIDGRLLEPYVVTAVKQFADQSLAGTYGPVDASAGKAYAAARAREHELREELEATRASMPMLLRQLGEADAERTLREAQNRLLEAENEAASLAAAADGARLYRVREDWAALTLDEQRSAIAAIFGGVLVSPSRQRGRDLRARVKLLSRSEYRRLDQAGHFIRRGRVKPNPGPVPWDWTTVA